MAEGALPSVTNDGESCVHAVERHLKRARMIDAIPGRCTTSSRDT